MKKFFANIVDHRCGNQGTQFKEIRGNHAPILLS